MDSCQQQQAPEYHEYVIIGGGIAGLQAALILAQNDRDFVLLQASDRLGGRIRTQRIGEVLELEKIPRQEWVNEQIVNTPVEVGATWISKEHSYILNMMKNYEISLFPQYSDGLVIYGVNEEKYEKVQNLTAFYKKYQKQVLTLVNKIQNLTLNMQELSNANDSPAQGKLLEEYIKYYDNITVSQYIREEIEDQELADIIMNEMETLECISCDNFSVLQLIDDNSCMELLRLYCEKIDDTIDGLKVKDGMLTLINKMKDHIFQTLEENESEFNRPDIIQLNSPVLEIQNQLGEDVIVKLKNGKKYSCMKVLFSVPVAVANQVKISRISPSKQLIFENQEYGSVTRFYFVFKEAFWRGRYSGYCSFSRQFPFNELTELSPSSLACGIVAFVFVHNKFQMWEQRTKQEHPEIENVRPLLVEYMLKVMADMFLDGKVDAPELKNYFTYMRSFKQLEYIRAAYQTTTKPQIWKQITESGDDYRDCYSRDQYNIIHIGSEIQDADDYGSYMEGALRVTRKKVYQQLGKQDPWKHLYNKIIEW